ncbi:hypothetical protein D3C86_670110 [compost metagenome]
MASISLWYLDSMILRRSFMVGVISPSSMEKALGSRVNFFTCSNLASSCCRSAIRASKNSTTLEWRSSSVLHWYCRLMERAYSSRDSKQGTISAETKWRASATMAICSMKRSLPRVPSTSCGATYLPLEVFISSLRRSVK